MMWIVIYSDTATKDIKELDRQNQERIIQKIRWFSERTYPVAFATKLASPFAHLYRFRIGDYRAFFRIVDRKTIQVLLILRVKHRKNGVKEKYWRLILIYCGFVKS